MSYFSDNYGALSYPIANATGGLYRPQIGAIHRISAHFTLDDSPALVTMPTGSGKTAVLMMTPFVLRANRVLVITPSKMVREQIVEDFAALVTLRKIGAIPSAVRSPIVKELKERVTSIADWNALRQFEVVVSTPNCASPAYDNTPEPPGDLFDLVLIDEAHHSPARTWLELLNAFPSARQVLFTATPFRRDRGEIKASFIYTYPVELAFEDGIFGKIRYVPVTLTEDDKSSDIPVAKKTEEVLREDRSNGLNHFAMVRTDSRARAKELLSLYQKETTLKLDIIHSGVSNRKVKAVLAALESGALDGIVCVDMLGEGFNFPRLKVAAIHAPHRSLEVTLQFIGRFARTNATDIGEAKFVAALSDIKVEGERLFDDSAVWQDIIQDLSYARIEQEVATREGLDTFDEPDAENELSDLSLYSLHPRTHVKIFDVTDDVVDLNISMKLRRSLEIRYHSVNSEGTVAIFICRQRGRPKWSATDKILDSQHMLVVLYHDRNRNLLFVNSSESSAGLYEAVTDAVAPDATTLSMRQVMRVIRRLRYQRIFNYGVRNTQATNVAESYRITAGPDAQLTMRASDARIYAQGHVYMTGDLNGERVTLGYSAGSKVWSSAHLRIPGLLNWCSALAAEIRDEAKVVTNTGLDLMPVGDVVMEIPPNVVLAQWHRDAFAIDEPGRVEYVGADGKTHRHLLMDLDISIDRAASTADSLQMTVSGPSLTHRVKFSLSEDAAELYEAVDPADQVRVVHGAIPISLAEYLNVAYLDMYTADGGVLCGNQLVVTSITANPIEGSQLISWDWLGADIKSELKTTSKGRSIHEHVRDRLALGSEEVVFIDHGSGEMADFVAVRRAGEAIEFTFYHCKGSSEEKPGARVQDVYEVCGQAQKSVLWRSLPQIRRRLSGRVQSVAYVRGDAATLEELLIEAETKVQRHQVVVVQPGISLKKLSESMKQNLGATSDQLRSAAFEALRIIGSE